MKTITVKVKKIVEPETYVDGIKQKRRAGYVLVETVERDFAFCMVDGSVQHIPRKHRQVGAQFELIWGRGLGGYHGWLYKEK